ncbi:MAG TPA: Ig-like domain-containing protein, partial [Gaiellaceae bacterium]|nr:Ig-like domain-containing protein [Gaiellaceae bacterium]
ASVALAGADGNYNVVVQVTDQAGNTLTTSRSITLDTTGPTIALSLPSPTNGTYYDVGATLTIGYNATDASGVGTIVVKLDSAMLTGNVIDLDTLAPGTHTIVITATDAAGNVSTKTVTFQVRATIAGLIAAVNDGVAKGFITAAEQTTLLADLKSAQVGSSAHAKLPRFVSDVQSQSGKAISAGYAALLVSWTNDLLSTL